MRKFFVEDHRLMEAAAIGVDRKVRNGAGFRPAELSVEILRLAAAARVEHKQPESGAAGLFFDSLHELHTDSIASGSTMHDQLGDVGAMRLIRRPTRMKLHRSDDVAAFARDEKNRTRPRLLER